MSLYAAHLILLELKKKKADSVGMDSEAQTTKPARTTPTPKTQATADSTTGGRR